MANEDPDYQDWIHDSPCCAVGLDGERCQGNTEVHHTGPRGLSQRAHDHTAIGLCLYHHACWHAASGPFKTWKKQQRREWSASVNTACRQTYLENRSHHDVYEAERN